jgi:hypothetical protein
MSRTPALVSESTRVVENEEYGGFARRIVKAHGKRVAKGDIAGLGDLARLRDAVEQATEVAVIGLKLDGGYSWAEIGRELDMTRQAAQQRWGAAVKVAEQARQA